ncbi:hypothetical protein D3C73_1431140 [compost metagenome]
MLANVNFAQTTLENADKVWSVIRRRQTRLEVLVVFQCESEVARKVGPKLIDRLICREQSLRFRPFLELQELGPLIVVDPTWPDRDLRKIQQHWFTGVLVLANFLDRTADLFSGVATDARPKDAN